MTVKLGNVGFFGDNSYSLFAKFSTVTGRGKTTYPGSNAMVLAETVAAPIEQEVNGVENMLYMYSTSANDGTYTLTVTFDVGTENSSELAFKSLFGHIDNHFLEVSNRGSQDVGCSMERRESDEKSDSILEMEHHFRSGGIGKSKMIYAHLYQNR